MIRRTLLSLAPLLLCLHFATPALAQDAAIVITIKNHRFEPETIEIPAQKKVKLVVKNLDAAPEEFESDDLHREKVVPAGKEVIVLIGPLKPGTYKFKGEYNPTTANGTVVVK